MIFFSYSHFFQKVRRRKSTDGPQMIETFRSALTAQGNENADMNDLLATAAKVTAMTIHGALSLLPGRIDELLVSGGGTCNKAIMGWLRSMCEPAVRVKAGNEFEVVSEAKEAIAFALLGAATLDGIPSNVRSVTGARRAVVLGSITPRP